MTLAEIEQLARAHHLAIFGAFHPNPDDKVPTGISTLVMLGPLEPGFWAMFTKTSEFQDGNEDPLDLWSERVIEDLANSLNAKAVFPFGGPPYQPFIRWAHRSGRAHQSPVGLLVHDQAGLMISYRGALGIEAKLDLPENPPRPCLTCDEKPCVMACPANAFGNGFYDVPSCKADLDNPENDCMSKGCAVRRVCPVSQHYGRTFEQSAFHMEAFK